MLDRVHAGTVAVAAVLIALAAAALCWWQLVHYEDNLIDIFAKQQDQYVDLAVDQIKAAESDDEHIVSNVLESIAGSNSQYWTLTKDGDFLFVKDVTDSNRYRGLPDSTYYSTDEAQQFVRNLAPGSVQHGVITIDDRQFIASGTEFEHNGTTYRICLLTGKNVVIDQNAYLAARVNLATTIAIVLALFVIGAIVMALHNDRKTKRLQQQDSEAVHLRATIERLGNQLMGRAPVDGHVKDNASGAVDASAAPTTPTNGQSTAHAASQSSASQPAPVSLSVLSKEAAMNASARRIYRFKFYLNASHYVFFNGHQGETHPHTWEFALKIQVDGNSLTQFSDYEDAISVVFAPYQDKNINEIDPFDALPPTLENLVEVFGARLHDTVEGMNAKLLEFEGSETPTRSYMVSYEQ